VVLVDGDGAPAQYPTIQNIPPHLRDNNLSRKTSISSVSMVFPPHTPPADTAISIPEHLEDYSL